MIISGSTILALWRRWSRIPGGRWIFSKMIGRAVPYSGTTRPRIEVLEPGRAIISLREHRKIRNHLRSVHAIALANVGELASGLAMMTALPPKVRGIVTRLSTHYVKKARGRLLATSAVEIPEFEGHADVEVHAEITDGSNEVVARVTVKWRLDKA